EPDRSTSGPIPPGAADRLNLRSTGSNSKEPMFEPAANASTTRGLKCAAISTPADVIVPAALALNPDVSGNRNMFGFGTSTDLPTPKLRAGTLVQRRRADSISA